jgi:queuine tRNA-ribosyltransferase
LTLRWARRSLEARRNDTTAIFGITQGGLFPHLRERAARELAALPFDGYAIGGLSVGERKDDMYGVLTYHPAHLPADKIRYLMGVGTPEDLVEAVYRGVDLFDCVMPTRAGRFGRAFVRGAEVQINIKNSRFVTETAPLDPTCRCVACRSYSRGYINHLFRVGEMLGPQLVSIHNVTHYLELMAAIRGAIAADSFAELYRAEKARWRTAPSEPAA